MLLPSPCGRGVGGEGPASPDVRPTRSGHARSTSLALIVATTLFGIIAPSSTARSDDKPESKSTATLSRKDARKLKSPVAFSKASVARGRILYTRLCTECHGADGKSQVDVIANATDLTNPKDWKSGTSEGEIYRSIRDGAGEAMPPFSDKISKDEDLWHLVNYLRSLWPDGARPKIVRGDTK